MRYRRFAEGDTVSGSNVDPVKTAKTNLPGLPPPVGTHPQPPPPQRRNASLRSFADRSAAKGNKTRLSQPRSGRYLSGPSVLTVTHQYAEEVGQILWQSGNAPQKDFAASHAQTKQRPSTLLPQPMVQFPAPRLLQ